MIEVFHQGAMTQMPEAHLIGPLAGGYENDNEITHWYEGYVCRCHGEIVKKSLHVEIKKQPAMTAEAGTIG